MAFKNELGDVMPALFQRLIFLIAAAILGLMYIAILLYARDPNVSVEYQALYLDQDLQSWPGQGGLAYSVGTDLDMTQPQPYLMKGWSNAETQGRWTASDEAGFVLHLPNVPASATLIGQMEVQHVFIKNETRRQKLLISFGVDHADKIELAIHRPGPIHFEVPRESISERGLMRIRYQLPECMSPKELGISRDKRCLGLYVKTFKIDFDQPASQ